MIREAARTGVGIRRFSRRPERQPVTGDPKVVLSSLDSDKAARGTDRRRGLKTKTSYAKIAQGPLGFTQTQHRCAKGPARISPSS